MYGWRDGIFDWNGTRVYTKEVNILNRLVHYVLVFICHLHDSCIFKYHHRTFIENGEYSLNWWWGTKYRFSALNWILDDHFTLEPPLQCNLLASYGNSNLIFCYYSETYPIIYTSTPHALSSRFVLVSRKTVRL